MEKRRGDEREKRRGWWKLSVEMWMSWRRVLDESGQSTADCRIFLGTIPSVHPILQPTEHKLVGMRGAIEGEGGLSFLHPASAHFSCP